MFKSAVFISLKSVADRRLNEGRRDFLNRKKKGCARNSLDRNTV